MQIDVGKWVETAGFVMVWSCATVCWKKKSFLWKCNTEERRLSKPPPVKTVTILFGPTALSGPGPPHSRGFQTTHNDTPQSVGLLWTSDRPVAETSTWQRTTQLTPMPTVGFEPTISAGERPQTYALDRATQLLVTIPKITKSVKALQEFLMEWRQSE